MEERERSQEMVCRAELLSLEALPRLEGAGQSKAAVELVLVSCRCHFHLWGEGLPSRLWCCSGGVQGDKSSKLGVSADWEGAVGGKEA